jgi:glycosyltransferase involved in cell wall biosynthesis
MAMVSVSVVLPVFNGARLLPATVESILGQSERDLELIAVDDGSTDDSAAVLERYAARDPRVRVLRQRENGGITRALIAGCDAATAPVIARQDNGDVSRPERLKRALALLKNNPECVLTACEAEYAGPEGERLYVTKHAALGVRDALLHAPLERLIGLPHHGTAVFRAEAYRRAGGYREQFYFAQDVDLWIRLAALGSICIDPEPLYEARTDLGAISSRYRDVQVASATLSLQLRDATSEETRQELLARAARIRPRAEARRRRADDAKALYFIASCLRQQANAKWRRYALRSLERNPLQLRAWAIFLRGSR